MRISKFTLAVSAALLVLSGCGGGSSSGASGSAGSANVLAVSSAASAASVNASEPPAGMVSHLDSGSGASNAVTPSVTEQRMRTLAVTSSSADATGLSYTYDADFSTLAPGWWINWWGSSAPSFTAGRETRAGYVNGGAASQMFTLNSLPADGGANLVYTYAFAQNTDYTIAVTVRADGPTRVRFQYRLDGAPYTEIASQTVTLNTGWQTVTLQGKYRFSTPGSVRVIPEDLGTPIYVGNMKITPTTATTSAVPVTTTIRGAIAGNALALPAQGTSAVSLSTVKYTSMDDAFTQFEDGWTINAMMGSAPYLWSASRETRPDHVYAGASSMRFQITNKQGGDIHLIAPYNFVKGKTYHATFYARADEATPIQAAIRVDAAPYENVSYSAVTLGTGWQRIDLEGAYSGDAAGTVRIVFPNQTATIWVDELTISEVSKNDLAPYSNSAIPDSLFGMHVNQLGVHQNWPGLGSKMIRLWDTGTSWRDIEPSAGNWDFHRLDMYVNYVAQKDPSANIIYTMGLTPLWASSTPTVNSLYGPGSGGAPANMSDWRDYVRTLARRYAGKIRYWELWNEPDYVPHWNGTWTQMAALAQVAREELLAADPNNKLIGPGFSAGQGNAGLDGFLTAGGGQYIDYVGYHWYYTTTPESIAAGMDNVRNIMKAHGVGDKQLWNTEGAFICNSALVNCATAAPTAEESISVNARALFIMANKGIQNFNYYFWEIGDTYGKLVQSDYATPTAAATAMAEARSWIAGASMVDAYRIDTSAYVMRFTRGSSNFVIVWGTAANTIVNIPAAWGVSKAKPLSGTQTAIPASAQIKIGPTPILLSN